MRAEVVIFILFVVIHLIICVLVWIGIRTRMLKLSIQLYPMILLVPVFGITAGLLAEWGTRRGKTGSKLLTLERLRARDSDYRTVSMSASQSEQKVVPLEEAILINDPETRRKLMIDILHQNPDEYTQLLQQARMNHDIEVAHYATTTIMEIQRDYELEVQKYMKMYDEDPDNLRVLEKYLQIMEKYIGSNLMDSYLLKDKRLEYQRLLARMIEKKPASKAYYYEAVENLIELEDYSSAYELIGALLRQWENDEKAWFLKLKLLQVTENSREFKETIQHMSDSHMYLSNEGRQMLKFWSRQVLPQQIDFKTEGNETP